MAGERRGGRKREEAGSSTQSVIVLDHLVYILPGVKEELLEKERPSPDGGGSATRKEKAAQTFPEQD